MKAALLRRRRSLDAPTDHAVELQTQRRTRHSSHYIEVRATDFIEAVPPRFSKQVDHSGQLVTPAPVAVQPRPPSYTLRRCGAPLDAFPPAPLLADSAAQCVDATRDGTKDGVVVAQDGIGVCENTPPANVRHSLPIDSCFTLVHHTIGQQRNSWHAVVDLDSEEEVDSTHMLSNAQSVCSISDAVPLSDIDGRSASDNDILWPRPERPELIVHRVASPPRSSWLSSVAQVIPSEAPVSDAVASTSSVVPLSAPAGSLSSVTSASISGAPGDDTSAGECAWQDGRFTVARRLSERLARLTTKRHSDCKPAPPPPTAPRTQYFLDDYATFMRPQPRKPRHSLFRMRTSIDIDPRRSLPSNSAAAAELSVTTSDDEYNPELELSSST